MPIGMVVRDARKRAGLTQHELAQILGVRAPSISRIECGARRPRHATLVRLANILDIDLNDLKFENEP